MNAMRMTANNGTPKDLHETRPITVDVDAMDGLVPERARAQADVAAMDPEAKLLKTPLVEVQDLSVRFGPVRAVSNVSYRLWPGEFLGIVGESGSGKSVAARALINLISASARVKGAVRFNGEDVLGFGPARLRSLRGSQIGFIFQDALAALDPVYSIGAQLVEVCRAKSQSMSRKDARARALSLLDEVGISDPERCFASYPHQLSGGMKQRVVIAAALISDPVLIIADEPTTALDVTVQRQVLDLLRDVAEARGVAVILITHDLGVVAETCDRVLVFYGGQIVEEAETRALFRAPRHPYTAALLHSLPKLGSGEGFVAIPGAPPLIVAEPAACPFAPRCARVLPACTDALPPETIDAGRRYRCLNPL